MVDGVSLGRAISERLRELRVDYGVPQERIAAEARQLGLDWSRATVADIERGRRQILIGELLLLPLILSRAGVWALEYSEIQGPRHGVERVETGRHPVAVTDLLPDEDRPILLAGSVQTSARALREFFSRLSGARLEVEGLKGSVGEEARGQADDLPRLWCQKVFESIREHRRRLTPPDGQWHPDHDETFWPSIGRDAADDATRKAAAVLHVPPIAVALAARACWNGVWGLTAEREHRLEGSLIITVVPNAHFTDQAQIARDWKLSEEQRQILSDWRLRGKQERALPPALRRKLQAVRGHFTRQLLAELRPLLKDVTKKKRRKT
jgi:transcriptional regulator with XRE-family HTH domain